MNRTRRRMMAARVQLPYDARVEWLGSSGSQFINTGVRPNAAYTVEVCFCTNNTSNGWHTVFGCRVGQSNRFTARFYQNGQNQLGYQRSTGANAVGNQTNDSNYTLTKANCYNTFHTVAIANNQVIVNNQVIATFNTATDLLLFAQPIYLFALNDGGNANDYGFNNIKTAKIYDENMNQLRDFIAVRVGQTGYMYDQVSGSLFGNAGSGNFTIGNDI